MAVNGLALVLKPLHGVPLRRVNVLLNSNTIDMALTIGDGSISAGFREEVLAWCQATKMSALDASGVKAMKIEAEYIRDVASWDSGGGLTVDIVELADGRVLGITDESVVLYQDMGALAAGEAMSDAGVIILA